MSSFNNAFNNLLSLLIELMLHISIKFFITSKVILLLELLRYLFSSSSTTILFS